MNKQFVSILIGLMMVGIGGSSWAGVTATDVVCTGCVNDADIANSAVTNGKIADAAVTNVKIADGAVTDVKITGPISVSKIEKTANVVAVAKTGGDYTTIAAALAAINPTADNPYVVKVMPGVYNESLTMKSYVHLMGAGRDVTAIESLSAGNAITLNGLVQVAISGFTIKVSGGGNVGIRNIASSPSISENAITIDGQGTGIYNESSSSPRIERNEVSGNGLGQCEFGIYNASSSPLVSGNILKGLGCYGIANFSSSPVILGNIIIKNAGDGISISDSSPTISGNTITADPNYYYNGISVGGNSSPTIINNRVTGHRQDINLGSPIAGNPNISFNIYNTFSGTGAVGLYNVKSDGTPAPLQ